MDSDKLIKNYLKSYLVCSLILLDDGFNMNLVRYGDHAWIFTRRFTCYSHLSIIVILNRAENKTSFVILPKFI